jgi:hypothetical protein
MAHAGCNIPSIILDILEKLLCKLGIFHSCYLDSDTLENSTVFVEKLNIMKAFPGT